VDFGLSLATDTVHQETCLCHCRKISSDDAENEAVQEERERRKCRNEIASVFYEMFEALKVKYCLVFTTVNFISVS
jgi:hypothetical protein